MDFSLPNIQGDYFASEGGNTLYLVFEETLKVEWSVPI